MTFKHDFNDLKLVTPFVGTRLKTSYFNQGHKH